MNHSKENYKGWKDELQGIINQNVKQRVNGKVASHRTQSDRANVIFLIFNVLRGRNFHVSPHNLKKKHVQVFCEHCDEKGLSAATIQTYLMHLRVFCRWIGKVNLCDDVDQYFNDPNRTKRTYVAKVDKSWTGNHVNIQEQLNRIAIEDRYLWIQIVVISAFGLRRKEAVSLRPLMSFIDDKLFVTDGTKGGKPRVVDVETEGQKWARAQALNFVGKTTRRLSHPELTLKQELSKYSRTMHKLGISQKMLGVTGHGLRHEFAHDLMLNKGLVPVVRGGQSGQMTKEDEIEIRLHASQQLGHNREGISSGYYGPRIGKEGKGDEPT